MITQVAMNTHFNCGHCGWVSKEVVQNYLRPIHRVSNEVGPHTWVTHACPSCSTHFTVARTDALNISVEQTSKAA